MAKKTKSEPVATPMEPFKLSGEVIKFQVLPDVPSRDYIVIPKMKFGQARLGMEAVTFNALKDEGFQRELVEKHVRELKKDMLDGMFTPTAWSASIRQEHLDNAVWSHHNTHITIEVTEEHKLDHSDGNHRKNAINLIRAAYEMAKEDGDQAAMDWIDSIPITALIFLDPDKTTQDFINQQKGLTIKKAQLESMELKAGIYPEKLREPKQMAHNIGIKLFRNKDSFLFGQISFDSNSTSTFSINVLSAHQGSVVGNKLYGGALISKAAETSFKAAKQPKWMSDMYVAAYQAILTFGTQETTQELGEEISVPSLFVPGNALCPSNLGGKKGGTEMLIGIGNMLAARCMFLGHETPTEDDLKRLAQCAEEVYLVDASGNLSDPRKRELLQVFARLFFEDVIESQDLVEYQGIPQELIDILSYSTFQLKPPGGKAGEEPEPEPEPEVVKPAAKPRSRKKAAAVA